MFTYATKFTIHRITCWWFTFITIKQRVRWIHSVLLFFQKPNTSQSYAGMDSSNVSNCWQFVFVLKFRCLRLFNITFKFKGRCDSGGCTSDSQCGGRGFEPHQRPRCFLEQETLPLLLSTGWFQERSRSWFHNRTKINWGPYGKLT